MSDRLGISVRTYLEYLRGTNAPLGMCVVLDLLSTLDDEDVARILRDWRALTHRKEVRKPIGKSARERN
jgi:hypothetical protein